MRDEGVAHPGSDDTVIDHPIDPALLMTHPAAVAEARAAREATAREAAERGREQALAAHDQTRARLKEQEQWIWRLTRTADEQRQTIAALVDERDAARAEADRARRQMDALTHRPAPPEHRGPGRHDPGEIAPGRVPAEYVEDVPAGLHALGDLNLNRPADPRT